MSSCVPDTFLLLYSKESSLATKEGSEKSARSRGFLQKACQGGYYLCVAVAWAMAVSLAQPLPCQGGLGLAASREPVTQSCSCRTTAWLRHCGAPCHSNPSGTTPRLGTLCCATP